MRKRSPFDWIFYESHKRKEPLSSKRVYRNMEYLGVGNFIKWILQATGGTIRLGWSWTLGTFSRKVKPDKIPEGDKHGPTKKDSASLQVPPTRYGPD